MPAKCKLTPERHKIIVDTIAAGGTDVMAYTRANVSCPTFYNWMKDGEKSKSGFKLEFFKAVTRAREQANLLAVVAFRTGLTNSETVEETRETFSETRMDKNGEPYTYTKTTIRNRVIHHPAEWRAGEAWLKRRDTEHWSDKITIQHEDFRDKAVEYIKKGELSFAAIEKEFDSDLATELFRAAGKTVQVGESASSNGSGNGHN